MEQAVQVAVEMVLAKLQMVATPGTALTGGGGGGNGNNGQLLLAAQAAQES
jgi:hypothetical protein